MSAPVAEARTSEVAASGLALGARGALARLASRSGALVAVAALGLAAVAGYLERRAAAAQAVDRALASVFDLVIPLLTFALVTIAIGRRRLQDAAWPIARFGADRRFVALGQVVAAAGLAAGLAAAAAALAVVTAHGPTSSPLALDAATSAWIGALTAVAYAGWFSLGATFLRAGGGRMVPLVADFLVGDLGLLGWVLPRGLAANLLGLVASGLPQRSASAVLAATAAVTIALAALRCRR